MRHISPRSKTVNRPEHASTEAYKTQAGDIKIETAPSLSGGTFQEHIITLYGAPKIGKTTLCSMFPGVYMLPTEPGYRWIKARKTYIPNWATFRKFVTAAEEKKNLFSDVKIFAIDTFTNLSKFCMQWVCGRDGIAHPSDQEWGKGWEAYFDEMAFWVLRLASLDKGLIFVAHEVEAESISRRMKITKYRPDLSKKAHTLSNSMSNMILHMAYVESSQRSEELGLLRCLYTKPSEHREAGDQTGRLPDVIKFRSEQQAVEKILDCFGETVVVHKHRKIKKKKKKRGGVR